MAQETAVSFLLRELRIEDLAKGEQLSILLQICEQAKAMEKEQIEWSWVNGKISTINKENKSSEQYYKETYGTEMPNL